jgi:hypothetical protein
MDADTGLLTGPAAGGPGEHEGRIRTCLPARADRGERGTGEGPRREAADQDWNVVRGED